MVPKSPFAPAFTLLGRFFNHTGRSWWRGGVAERSVAAGGAGAGGLGHRPLDGSVLERLSPQRTGHWYVSFFPFFIVVSEPLMQYHRDYSQPTRRHLLF